MSQPEYSREASLGHQFSIAVLHADVHLPGCQSLKEKRGRLARIMNHLKKTHPIVVAEVGDQNVWGRAGLAAVTLSSDENIARRVSEAAAQTIMGDRDVELLWHEVEIV